ncbi:MAG: hypothetical protein EOP83_13270 [Verrucomicrobiaceae bacterium]|nr:MAG: hypothetical protein EOP83_13270 [Verrucomicrobiaceae bacterium]
MAPAFSIGKRGPTICQGVGDPNSINQIGLNGDLYVQIGETPKLYQFRVSKWVDLTGEVFIRTPITSDLYSILPTDYYVGVRSTSATTLVLPAGQIGKKIIVKDEVGAASTSTPITIMTSGSETIDGASTVVINTARSSLTFVYGVEWHII